MNVCWNLLYTYLPFYYNNAHAQLQPNFNFVNIICLQNMTNKDYYYYYYFIQAQNRIDCCHSTPKFFSMGETPQPPSFL